MPLPLDGAHRAPAQLRGVGVHSEEQGTTGEADSTLALHKGQQVRQQVCGQVA